MTISRSPIANKSSNPFRPTDHRNPPTTQPKNPYLMTEPSTRNSNEIVNTSNVISKCPSIPTFIN